MLHHRVLDYQAPNWGTLLVLEVKNGRLRGDMI